LGLLRFFVSFFLLKSLKTSAFNNHSHSLILILENKIYWLWPRDLVSLATNAAASKYSYMGKLRQLPCVVHADTRCYFYSIKSPLIRFQFVNVLTYGFAISNFIFSSACNTRIIDSASPRGCLALAHHYSASICALEILLLTCLLTYLF